MKGVSGLLKLLGDDARLRLLRVLSFEALNVSELTAILGIAQSGVSRHLGLLREAGLVTEERTGGYTWYSLVPGHDERAPLWQWLRQEFGATTAETRGDDARLQEVRRVRKESFVEHGVSGEHGQMVPGRSWAAWSRALGMLLPAADVADLGCGEGYLSIEAARWARKVIAIDHAEAVLARGRALATRRKVRNITWQRGTLEHLPLADASVDIALLSQALHHAEQPAEALDEAHRVLRPGGRVLVLDLREHKEEWVRAKLGDRWLGFRDDQLHNLLSNAGFSHVTVRVGARTPGDPFTVLIAAGAKANLASSNITKTRSSARSRRLRRSGVSGHGDTAS
ncbi:MAG: metalloregulator ArsR/SmtB family transcription factor [Acidobacteriota bacterium]